MSGIWGNSIKISIFGESHGKAIGITIDGLKAGILLDFDYIKKEMQRRAPGNNEYSTPRTEEDEYEVISGCFEGRTTGTPLCAMIYNTNKKSEDYAKLKNIMRPSHGDYTGYVKYSGFNDYRGGGHFSGRLTAPLVFAGAICRQLLESRGITIGSHIKSIGEEQDESFDAVSVEASTLKILGSKAFPVLNAKSEALMKAVIARAMEQRDSVGGVVEAAVLGLEPGIGEPFFDSAESTLAHLIFSIPGVKGLEFGAGFDISSMNGSKANDEYYMDGEKIRTYSNNNGGILGGITDGMPLIFRAAFKPTPSIGRLQRTIDIEKRENTEIEVQGRHDPCIVPRAIPVVEAVAAIALFDLIMQFERK
ncbi:MAG TPA: chorismate synthase [Clostridia bacterium]|nr:chorismate synthase [Clostridia bacterium]